MRRGRGNPSEGSPSLKRKSSVGAGLTSAVAAPATPAERVLVVLPAGDEARTDVSGETPVAGLPLVRRIALAGARAGFSSVRVAGVWPGASSLLAGTGATPLAPEISAPPAGALCRIVLLPINVVPRPQSLRALLELPLEPERLYADRSNAIVLDVEDAAAVLGLAARSSSPSDLRAALRARFGADDVMLDVAAGVRLDRRTDVREAETWLLRSLIKPSEGIMSRHFERRVSLAVTRRLMTTGMTPNAMTLVSVAIGLSGAPFFLSPEPALQLTGALLFLVHSILDGCDGELARLKFLESPRGAVLDFWGDNVVHAAVFSAIAIGWARQVQALWPIELGMLAVASTGFVALFVWRRGLLDWALDEHAPPRARLIATLVHRDFIYVILVLAVFGKAGWFVAATAAGAPIFLGVLVWAARGRSPV